MTNIGKFVGDFNKLLQCPASINYHPNLNKEPAWRTRSRDPELQNAKLLFLSIQAHIFLVDMVLFLE